MDRAVKNGDATAVVLTPVRAARRPAQQRRAELMETALELFSEHGFAGTSMQDLATRMAVDKSSLYQLVTSKEQILDTLLEDHAERLFARAHAALDQDTHPHQTLERFLDDVMAFACAEPRLTRLLAVEQFSVSARARRMLLSARADLIARVITFLQRGVEQRAFRADLDCHHTAHLLAAVDQMTQSAGSTTPDPALVRTVRSAILRSLL